MLHFAVDSPDYKEKKVCMTWKDGLGVLLREYSKKQGKDKVVRKEKQVHPKTTLGDFSERIINNSILDTLDSSPDMCDGNSALLKED